MVRFGGCRKPFAMIANRSPRFTARAALFSPTLRKRKRSPTAWNCSAGPTSRTWIWITSRRSRTSPRLSPTNATTR
ncbi:hypothetical protein BDFB_012339 [Asbolus verrucosus]|uniref:Uncharacterized protein n=1 Tax=Asbolus verrucosus TaxID=1661398 RepID=A0A482VYT9_ASBVE|nr:hypothetical protein BDFB_012339 [Asbolus verrucosus]